MAQGSQAHCWMRLDMAVGLLIFQNELWKVIQSWPKPFTSTEFLCNRIGGVDLLVLQNIRLCDAGEHRCAERASELEQRFYDTSESRRGRAQGRSKGGPKRQQNDFTRQQTPKGTADLTGFNLIHLSCTSSAPTRGAALLCTALVGFRPTTVPCYYRTRS